MNLQEWELLAAAAAYQLEETREDRKVSRIDEIRAAMRRYEAELLQLERFGDGARFVDGDVIRFTKTHDAGAGKFEHSYTYAAIKTPAGWYMTGQHRKPQVTYDELITFITNYPVATDVQVAWSWVSIDDVSEARSAKTKAFDDPNATYVAASNWISPEINTLGTPAPTAEQRDYEIK